MKFFCEYCGSRIDSNVDDKCPHCGASYKKNKTFLRMEEENNKDKELNRENKQKIVNHAIKFSKMIFIIPIVMFTLIIIVFISISVSVSNRANKAKDKIESSAESILNSIIESDMMQDQISEKEEKEVTVTFNEYGATTNYKAKVTGYKVVEDMFNRLQDGYEYVEFNLQVENISGEQIRREDVNCIVDGIAQTNKMSSGYSELPFHIQKGLTVKGTATFEVPKDATSYDIKYGDYITIHIEK